jgi:drug/metabolite transporter (DMT)-like permease
MLATVVLAWGLTWPVNKLILESMSPLAFAAVRSAVGTVAVFALVLATGRLAWPDRGDVPVLLSITLLHMVGFVVLANIGLQLVPTGRSVVLAYTTPLWVTPGARLFLGEALTPRRIAGVGIGLAGLVVMFNPLAFDWTDQRSLLGHVSILGAALLWAGSILHVRGHRWRGSAFDLIPWEMLLATVVLLPVAALAGTEVVVAWDARLWALLLYSAIPGTVLACWAVATAGRLLPAVTTSLGLLGTPVVSVIVAALWLGEVPGASLIVAIVLILGGVALGSTDDKRIGEMRAR